MRCNMGISAEKTGIFFLLAKSEKERDWSLIQQRAMMFFQTKWIHQNQNSM